MKIKVLALAVAVFLFCGGVSLAKKPSKPQKPSKVVGTLTGEADIPWFDICGVCSVNHYTSFYITNISELDLEVTLEFHTDDGELFKDDGTAHAGLIFLNNPPAGSFWDYTDDPISADSVEFTLAAGKMVILQLAHNTNYKLRGYGKIKWESEERISEGLLVQGQVTMATAPYLAAYAVPVNAGIAF